MRVQYNYRYAKDGKRIGILLRDKKGRAVYLGNNPPLNEELQKEELECLWEDAQIVVVETGLFGKVYDAFLRGDKETQNSLDKKLRNQLVAQKIELDF